MTFGGTTLPHVLKVQQQRARLFLEVPLPGRQFSYRADLGGKGDTFTVDGYLVSADAVTRAQISALADGTGRILDLQQSNLQPLDNVLYQSATHRVQGARAVWSSGTSFSPSYGSTPTPGNTEIAVIGTQGASSNIITVSNITETNVAWTKIAGISLVVSIYGFNVEIWMGLVGADLGTGRTINLSATPVAAIADFYEYFGLLQLDQTATASSAGSTTPNTGTTPVTTQPSQLLIGAINAGGTSNQTTPTNGFTLLDGLNTSFTGGYYMSLAFLENIVGKIAAYTTGTSITATAGSVGCIATFKNTAWADDTLAARLGLGPAFTLLASTTDYLYFGYHEKFNSIQFTLSQLASYGILALEYSQGSGNWNSFPPVGSVVLWAQRADFPPGSLGTDTSGFGGGGFRAIFADGRIIRYGVYKDVSAGWPLLTGGNEFIKNLTQTQAVGNWHQYVENVAADYFTQWGTAAPALQELQLFANCNVNYVNSIGWDAISYLPNGDFEQPLAFGDWGYDTAYLYGRYAGGGGYSGSYSAFTAWDGIAGHVSIMGALASNIYGTDGTVNFSRSGSLTFPPPSDWKQDTVNGVGNRFWVRVSVPSVTTAGTVSKILLNPVYNCILLDPQYTMEPTLWDQTNYQLTFQQLENP